ncbi:MAG: hypothetical protein QMC90_02170 [Dehalococcoidales bacterium]|nr:hypothetical protein [Dehalococcoidales bacterium]
MRLELASVLDAGARLAVSFCRYPQFSRAPGFTSLTAEATIVIRWRKIKETEIQDNGKSKMADSEVTTCLR